MKDATYAGLNTSVRINETRLLDHEDIVALIGSRNFKSALDLLNSSRYALDVPTILKTHDFESVLIAELSEQYEVMRANSPDPRVIQLLTTRYTFHNLKVLIKMAILEENLKKNLIPIGPYKLKTLQNLIEIGESEQVTSTMIEAVIKAKDTYGIYQQNAAIDVVLDDFYFKQLRRLAVALDDIRTTELVDRMIDGQNLVTVLRARHQSMPRSILYSVISGEGTVDRKELIDAAMTESLSDILSLYSEKNYHSLLEGLFHGKTDQSTPIKLDLLSDRLVNDYLKEAVFVGTGPLPVLAYLNAVEREIKNLRVILTGKLNGFEKSTIEERMRPINVI